MAKRSGDPAQGHQERLQRGVPPQGHLRILAGGERRGKKDLLEFAKNDPSTRVRGEAIFWLAQAGGRKWRADISSVIENDPDTQLKEKAVFALSQMPQDEGVPLLINVAKTNKNPAVRKKAIFWLGRTNDPRALDFLEEILFGGKAN